MCAPTERARTTGLEDFDRKVLGSGADGEHGDEGVGTGAEDSEVGGIFVNDEKHRGLFAGVGGRKAHGGRRGTDRDGPADATI